MTKTMGQLSQDIKEFFKLTFIPKFGIGRKVSPVYVVNPVPEVQANAVLNKAVVQNTWETVLDTTVNVRLIKFSFRMTTLAEDIEVRVTDDVGSEIIAQAAAVAGTDYSLSISLLGTGSTTRYALSTTDYNHPFTLESRSLKVEIRKTTANGANNLQATCKYAKW